MHTDRKLCTDFSVSYLLDETSSPSWTKNNDGFSENRNHIINERNEDKLDVLSHSQEWIKEEALDMVAKRVNNGQDLFDKSYSDDHTSTISNSFNHSDRSKIKHHSDEVDNSTPLFPSSLFPTVSSPLNNIFVDNHTIKNPDINAYLIQLMQINQYFSPLSLLDPQSVRTTLNLKNINSSFQMNRPNDMKLSIAHIHDTNEARLIDNNLNCNSNSYLSSYLTQPVSLTSKLTQSNYEKESFNMIDKHALDMVTMMNPTLNFMCSPFNSTIITASTTTTTPILSIAQPSLVTLTTTHRRNTLRRAVFSETQRRGLEQAFRQHAYITKPDRKILAEKLGLRDVQVKIWFQNRRMKWRNLRLRSGLSASNCSTISDPKNAIRLTNEISALNKEDALSECTSPMNRSNQSTIESNQTNVIKNQSLFSGSCQPYQQYSHLHQPHYYDQKPHFDLTTSLMKISHTDRSSLDQI